VPDKYNVVALHFQSDDGRIGFAGRAPVFAGYHEECILSGTWELHAGDLAEPEPAIGEPVAARPSTAAYDEFRPATSTLRRPSELSPGRHLPPDESLAAMRTAETLAVDLVLSEPQIAQPLSLDFDERGRLWVVEYRQYPYPAGIQMVSRDKYYRATYDQVPPAPPNHVRGADRISVHEDTDSDGTFDRHHVFMDGLNMVSSVDPAYGGVWVLNPPYLLFVPDSDGDAVPDGDPEVHLAGFGLEDTHSIANSLTWGPDGWLYGAQGSTTSSRIKVYGDDGQTRTDQPEVYRDGATIWRYHPPTRRYEIFAEGGGNAFGIEIDAQGRLFSGHNGNDTRGFHYVQGAYMQKGTGNKYGPLSNPHAYGHLMYMKHAPTPRFSHDLVKYEGVGLPQHYLGKMFAIDPMHRNVVLVAMHERGATYSTEDLGTPLASDDFAFRPVDITTGPDGAIYIADFCEEFIAHGQHYQGQIAVGTGRVYRLRAADRKRHSSLANIDYRSLSTEELVARLAAADRWHRRAALRVLSERGDASAVDGLRQLLRTSAGQPALEALWAIHLLGGFDDARAVEALAHQNPAVRTWAVRLLGDRGQVSTELAAKLVELATEERDPEVRAQLACTAKRLPAEPCLEIAAALCRHDKDADDPYIPHLIWWAIESKADERDRVLSLFPDPVLWEEPLVLDTLLERVMRRYASGGRADWEVCAELLELAPDGAATERLLAGFEAGLRGRAVASLPPRLVQALLAAGGGSISLRVRQGDEAAIQEALAALASSEVERDERLEYIRLFGEVRRPAAAAAMMQIVESSEEPELVAAALASLQAYDDEQIAASVLARLADWPEELRGSGLSLLASRPAWAHTLLKAIEHGDLASDAVSADVVERMATHDHPHIDDLVAKLWPDRQARSSSAISRMLQRATSALATGDADPYRGHELFTANCAKCHVLFREGGRIGPDLTPYQRDDTERMLMHVAHPSVEIREGFETWLVTTVDGRVVSGFLFDQDANIVTLRGADGQNITIPRDDIEEMGRSPTSLMPEGLLADLSEQQIRDLFAYLRVSQPLNE
jgi:putative membrane-bound dehydrogenase-like protein